jgi:hypothetical protein
VQLVRDWRGEADLDGYVLTSTARTLALRIVDELREHGGSRAWSITGPYGSGKSAFALFLADLLARVSPKHASGRSLREDTSLRSSTLLPVLVVGQRAPIKPAILVALAESLRSVAPSLADEVTDISRSAAYTDEQVTALVERANESAREAGWDGLLIILDEFGKFLEHAALHPDTEDLFVMQHLAEAAARDLKPNLLITLLHTGFSDYLSPTADETRKAEWRKVQGRFADVAFLEPPEQLLELVATAVSRRLPTDVEASYSDAVGAALASSALAEARRRLRLEESLLGCVPLDPVVTLLLWPLFRSKLAQNERSLFAFLTSEEPFGFGEFLKHGDPRGNPLPLYRVDRLYDYVVTALGAGVYRGDAARRWTEVEQALDRIGGDAPEATNKVVKAIGLISTYGASVGLKACAETLSLALGFGEVDEQLSYLERTSIAVYRRHEGAYGLWEGSDIDLDARFDDAMERLDRGKLAERLRRAVTLWSVVARAHYIKTGTLRYFDVDLIDGTEEMLRKCLKKETVADGQISFLLCRPEDRADLVKLGRQLTQDSSPSERLRVLAFPDPIAGLEEALEEVEGWRWVEDNVAALRGDPVARRELQARKGHAQLRLEEVAGRVLGLRGHRFDPTCSEWVRNGRSHNPVSARNFARWLSELCGNVYSQAPELQNELLNRERLSSAAAAARRNLLESMLEHEGEHRLGFTGTPAEVSMYESMLFAGGFHRERAGEWRFGEPNSRWLSVWEAIETFLDGAREKRRPVEELFALLKQPPFGLRDGPLPVLLCAVVLANKHNLALYENGVFVTDPSIELFERLLRVPEAFSVRRFALTGRGREALGAVGRTIGVLLDGKDPGAKPDVLRVVKPLVLFANGLPAYTKRTKRVAPQTMALREVLLRARDPHDLLFSELPDALDVPSELMAKEPAELTGALQECVVELQRAYPRLLEYIEQQLREQFDLKGDPEEARSQLETRARPLVGYAGSQMLGVFVREAARLENGSWREVLARTLADGMPPEHWRDRDRATFDVRLQEVASGFVRLEELAAEKGRVGQENSQVFRIGILNGHVREARALIAVHPDREPMVEDLAGKLTEVLAAEQPAGGEEQRRLGLAALARVAMEHLKTEGKEDG